MKFGVMSMTIVRWGLRFATLLCLALAWPYQVAMAEITLGSETSDSDSVVIQSASVAPSVADPIVLEAVVQVHAAPKSLAAVPTVNESAAHEAVAEDPVATHSAIESAMTVTAPDVPESSSQTDLDTVVAEFVATQIAVEDKSDSFASKVSDSVTAERDDSSVAAIETASINADIIYHSPAEFADIALPQDNQLQSWIAEMKIAKRGPFKRIRWFCADGYIYPPKPYGCSSYGGGVQHGEWTDRVKMLRSHGFLIANVLADLDAATFIHQPDWQNQLEQMVVEQFLITADDGWILRQARYYRGALQIEDETRHGRAILNGLLNQHDLAGNRFLLLREAVRLLPHGRYRASLSKMRQMSRTIAEQDAGFEPLRIKLHVRPEPEDAVRIKDYSREQGQAELQADYQQLAAQLAELYQPQPLVATLEETSLLLGRSALATQLRRYGAQLTQELPAVQHYATICSLLALVRDGMQTSAAANGRLALLHLSLDLELQLFNAANSWLAQLPELSRRQQLNWLQQSVEALYGIGLLSARERRLLQKTVPQAQQLTLPVSDYLQRLTLLARVPEWAEGKLHQLFAPTLQHWSRIEPLVSLYLPDRLRGSVLTAYATVLDSLSEDAKQLSGIGNELFGEPLAAGVTALNPGMARGRLLRWQPGMALTDVDPTAIYILPETVAELPRIAGIITAGRGNALSHVQLLARNLAIPNVAIDKRLLPRLESYLGQVVVLASSPGGVVVVAVDDPQWRKLFVQQTEQIARESSPLIESDLDKLDLSVTNLIPLEQLTSADSGRIAGPKAANLGELKAQFPELVADGLVVPFGVFRQFLQQPMGAAGGDDDGGLAAFDWLQQQYAELATISDATVRHQATMAMLTTLRQWITTTPLSAELRQQLQRALEKTFRSAGRDYGVFVRSDTNVEDLPGFTGAGLNKTVPHVVGFEAIVAAIRQVWASPFSERAYGWRQAHMAHPEQVYASVLLMKSIAVDKSGVLVTQDIFNGRRDRFTVAINEGIGGAVAGQRAEELLLDIASGDIHLLTQASEPTKRLLAKSGGIVKVAASGHDAVLSRDEARQLVAMGQNLPRRFNASHPDQSVQADSIPSQSFDIEFGFVAGTFVLFQIRPFVESGWARSSRFLAELDGQQMVDGSRLIELDQRREEGP